jgi:DNA helicase-2/ATP-dependent DNA helicase PcrA
MLIARPHTSLKHRMDPTAGYEVDHIRPLALGGTNGLTNLQALCPSCHVRKTRSQRHDLLASRDARAAAATTTANVTEDTISGSPQASDPTVDTSRRTSASADTALTNVDSLSLDSIELSSLRLLRGMNQQQLAAVVCADGPLRVAAGPGTGKTRVLTARIAHLVVETKVPPQRVLAVTFTNKAARELRERITALIGPDGADSITMGTFHSLCLAMLRVDVERLPPELGYRRGFAVYDEYASLKLIRKLKERVEGGAPSGGAQRTKEQKEQDELSAAAVQALISAAKNDGHDAASFREHPPRRVHHLPAARLSQVSQVFALYEETMRRENIIDFDDMLLLTTALLRTSERTRRKYASHWRHITVDEFQDTNTVQYQLLSLLGRDHHNVFVVGDADQAIYGWRGADIRNQARLDSDFVIRPLPPAVPAAPLPPAAFESVAALKAAVRELPLPPLPRSGGGRKLSLELNYRSNQHILDMAHRLLAPAYAADPSSQLSLVTPDTYGCAEDGAGRRVGQGSRAVSVIGVDDWEHEAEYVVDEILRLRGTIPLPTSAGEAPVVPSIAILYRTNAQSMTFERRLVREGVPYVLAAQRSFYARKEIRDALAYMRLLRSNDSIALERIINVPPRKIGAATLATLHGAVANQGISLWEAVELYAREGDGDGDTLPPMAKGARAAVRRFHTLITRFRGLVEAELEDVSLGTGGQRTADGDGIDEEVRLQMVSSDIRRRLRHPHVRDPEGPQARIAEAVAEEEAASAAAAGDFAAATAAAAVELDSADVGDEEAGSKGNRSLASLLRLMLAESGYEAFLKGGKDESESNSRWRNLGELAQLASERSVDEIDAFLDQIALVSDVDALDAQGARSAGAERQRAVQLSTIHGAKGLEFDHVFVTGVEEGLLPHYYCSDELEEVEQERRLLYVAMTRARKQLVLTHSSVRARWGKVTPVERSRFLDDLPGELNSEAPRPHTPSWGRRRTRSHQDSHTRWE